MSGAEQQLWCSVPEGDHHWIQVSQRLQRRIEQPCESHVGDLDSTSLYALTIHRRGSNTAKPRSVEGQAEVTQGARVRHSCRSCALCRRIFSGTSALADHGTPVKTESRAQQEQGASAASGRHCDIRYKMKTIGSHSLITRSICHRVSTSVQAPRHVPRPPSVSPRP